jgi:hypothetical protein
MGMHWDRAPWENWAADVVIDRPERHCYPTTLDDLVQTVRSAETANPARKVRGCGAHWALSDIAVSPDWFLETRALRATHYYVIPEALSDRARRDLVNQPSGTRQRFTYYHVEAGITIRDLNLRLDRQPLPEADARWARMPTDQLLGDSSTRWALPTMPGSSGQTLAGAISTGSHGGDHGLPPLADVVQVIHLVTAGGTQLWIERSQPVTDPERLARAVPEVIPRYSTELFNAALVSVGRMGVIYAFVLRVVEQFSLEQHITVSTWDAVEAQCRPPFPIFQCTPPGENKSTGASSVFVEVVLLPYAKSDNTRSCYVTHRWKGPDNIRQKRPPAGLFTLICRRRTIRPLLLALLGINILVALVLLLLPGAFAVAAVPGVVALILLVLCIGFGGLSVGDLLAGTCNMCNRLGQAKVIRAVNELVIARFRPTKKIRDVGYEVMDMSWAGLDCYRADSIEVLFDAAFGAHITYIQDELFPALDRAAASGASTAGYISLRFTGRSSALLGMQRWETTCGIEVALLQGINGNLTLHNELQAAAVRHGGTVHWGQHNTLSRSEVALAFPALGRWRAQLSQLGHFGRLGTFDNKFCRDRNLEPG